MRVSLPPLRLVALGAVLALGACSSMSDVLGIGKLPPDEYAVAPRRPLAMPPDISLRAPQPGAAAPADISASGVAARAMATTGTGTQAAPAEPVQAAPVPPPSAPPSAPPTDTTSTTTGDGTGRVMQTGKP